MFSQMKLIAFTMILIVTSFGVFAAQSLNAASAESQKINLAVLTLKNASGISEGEASLISDRLRGELFNTGKANVMERDQMSEILKEQGFQQSGSCSDEACLVQMGQMLGVQAIVSGSIGKLGSMYLINFRVIDVKTGKITAVVSRDLKGEIEDVVEFLKGIADDLVSGAAGKKVEGSAQQIQSEHPAERPAEEVKTEEPKEEEKPKEATIDGDKAMLNKNRGGLRISFTMLPGEPVVFFDDVEHPRYEPTDSAWSYSHLLKLDLMFMIKAGPWLAINIGPNFAWFTQQFKYTEYLTGNEGQIDAFFGQVGFQPGVNFVKRWHPIKLNVGVFADLNMAWYNTDLTMKDQYGIALDTVTNTNDIGVGFTAGWGGRAGVEFLIKNRVGFNFDFVFRYCSWEPYALTSDSETGHIKTMYNYQDPNSYLFFPTEPTITMRLPMFGFDAGVNFYF